VVDGGKSLFCFAKKVTKKGEPAALFFVFVFFVAAISADYRAARKLAVTFISNLNHRVAQTGSRRRPPIVSKNIVGAEGWAIRSSNLQSVACAVRTKMYARAQPYSTHPYSFVRSPKKCRAQSYCAVWQSHTLTSNSDSGLSNIKRQVYLPFGAIGIAPYFV
jgi:hypothetical protein